MFDDYTVGLIQLEALDKELIEAGEIWRFPAKFSPQNRKFILVFIAIGMVLTFVVPDITYAGHIGGLISGVVVAWFITMLDKKQIEKSFY